MLEKDSTIIEETDNCGAAELAEETASSQPQQTPKEQKATGGDTVRTVQKILAWILSAALLLVGIAAGALAIHIGMHYPGQKPILLTKPEAAIRQVSGMMEAICDGDYDKASTYLLGTPRLGVAEPPESPLGILLWNAFLDSTEFALVGDCYTTDVGLAQNVSFTYLDSASVTANLRERSQTLLNQRVEEAEDVSEIYDENNEYRESVVMEALQEAVKAALQEDAETVTVSLTVNLKYQNGTWWVVVDNALLDAFSGGIGY